jgi:hypothetical protein
LQVLQQANPRCLQAAPRRSIREVVELQNYMPAGTRRNLGQRTHGERAIGGYAQCPRTQKDSVILIPNKVSRTRSGSGGKKCERREKCSGACEDGKPPRMPFPTARAETHPRPAKLTVYLHRTDSVQSFPRSLPIA